jgi:immune inhibitor A
VITVTWPSFAVTGTASVTSGISPLSVDFTCTPSGGNGVYSYSWDFGDQSSVSTAKNPTHEFSSSGTYTVTVTVTDTASNTAHWSQVITVTKPSSALTSPMVIGGIIAVIAVIGVIVAVVFLGRKKKTAGKGSTPPVQGPGSP